MSEIPTSGLTKMDIFKYATKKAGEYEKKRLESSGFHSSSKPALVNPQEKTEMNSSPSGKLIIQTRVPISGLRSGYLPQFKSSTNLKLPLLQYQVAGSTQPEQQTSTAKVNRISFSNHQTLSSTGQFQSAVTVDSNSQSPDKLYMPKPLFKLKEIFSNGHESQGIDVH